MQQAHLLFHFLHLVIHLFGFVCSFKVDVSGAYESLPHNKLIEVIRQVLLPVADEPFTVRCYAKIWADSHEGLKKAFVRQVSSWRLLF